MKRTYVNRLPKGDEVKNTNVIIENGELIVEVEFKEKFEPKDGDFLASDNDVFIYNGKQTEESYGAYLGVLGNGKIDKALTNDSWTDKASCRYATELEKKAFLLRLEKEYGKKWNAKRKCLEDIYIPKFGDIVRIEYPGVNRYKRNYVISIFPDKEVPEKSVAGFFDIANIDMNGNIGIKDDAYSYYNYNHVFLASESEKQELFDKLTEVGKRWNPETKQLEDIRWRAKKGGKYYRVTTSGVFEVEECEETCSSISYLDYSCGNYFRTKEAAKKVADQIKEIFKNSKAE